MLINTGALTSASLWRIAISFVLQILIARRLGVEGLGHYTIALAYLNVSQVIVELGLPTLLVRDLAQNPTHRRTYFRWLLGIQLLTSLLTWAGLILLSFVLPFAPVTAASFWLVGASLPLYAVTSAAETLFQAGERMELVMGVEVAINTLILLISLGVLWQGGDELALIAVIIATQAVSAALCLLLLCAAGCWLPLRRVPIDLAHAAAPDAAVLWPGAVRCAAAAAGYSAAWLHRRAGGDRHLQRGVQRRARADEADPELLAPSTRR